MSLDYIVEAFGWTYVSLSAALFGLAIWLPTGMRAKSASAIMAVALVCVLPTQRYEDFVASGQVTQATRVADQRARRAKAQALFEKHCEHAGERVLKTVNDVEGVILKNLRPTEISPYSQNDTNDQYGYNAGGID